MYKFVFAGTVLFAGVHSHMYHPINHEIVEEINRKAKTWKAMHPDKNPLRLLPESTLRGLMGTIITTSDMEFPDPLTMVTNQELPDNFDPRDKWGSCIHPIRD